MLIEKSSDKYFAPIAKPSSDVILVLKELLTDIADPHIAEVGVGIGATTLEIAKHLDGRGIVYLFDFARIITPLISDLKERGYENVQGFGNSDKLHDSYCWSLAKVLLQKEKPFLDFAYLDGAHTFIHDAPAAVLLAKMIKPGGLLLFDDMNWTMKASPTMNPQVNPVTAERFTVEQIETAQVGMICEIFFDGNSEFQRETIRGRVTAGRALYRKVS